MTETNPSTQPPKNSWLTLVTPVVSLALLCLFVALSISGTYALTHERIVAHREAAMFAGMERLIAADQYQLVFYDETNDFALYEAISNQGMVKGHLLLTSVFGYSGDVSVLTAISEGRVIAIEIVDATGETPGLGQNILDPDFVGEFQNLTVPPTLVRGDPTAHGEIGTLTGATISAQAVVDAVGFAMELYETHVTK